MYKQDDVDEWVNENGEDDASKLFDEVLPKHRAKLNRLDKKIAEVLLEIQQEFPDAEYYTASGGFNLILGHSHDDRSGHGQQHRMAWSGTKAAIGDGDF